MPPVQNQPVLAHRPGQAGRTAVCRNDLADSNFSRPRPQEPERRDPNRHAVCSAFGFVALVIVLALVRDTVLVLAILRVLLLVLVIVFCACSCAFA